MNLNLFENKDRNNDFIEKFIEELRDKIKNNQSKKEEKNVLEEYDLYEKRKNFLDNASRKGNNLAWIMDENSVCISENGDGGPISIDKINLPETAKIGEVYEIYDGEYIYNSNLTNKLKEIN